MAKSLHRKLRFGMVGGGRDAFIGGVHRIAASMDGRAELAAGCFSSKPEKSKLSGRDLFLPDERIYNDYESMAKVEAARDDGIDFVIIATPNNLHYPVARAFIESEIPVVSDKPATFNLQEARNLKRLIERKGAFYALTHNYTGYPLVKEARQWVKRGKLGKILKIVAEYPQGWLLDALEESGQKQASWRTDPEKAGASCCIADIGTHAENLGRYITGLEIESLMAEFTTFVPGRKLEDDANVLIRYQGGAKGVLYASQISAGEENGPHIRVYGTKASLEWHQPEPNALIVKYPDRPSEILRPSNPYLSAEAARLSRVPPGHPEAFFEAFANIYSEVFRALEDRILGRKAKAYDFPGIEDGVVGMAFIEACVKSAQNSRWTKMPKV